MQLPIVDYTHPNAAQDFCRNLHETGFGVLAKHPLSQSLVDGIYAEWLGFFNSEAKHNYAQDPIKLDGYFSPAVSETAKDHTVRDLKEFFHIFPWGRYPAEVSDAAKRYYAAGNALANPMAPVVCNDAASALQKAYLSLHLVVIGMPFTELRGRACIQGVY